MGTGGRPVIDNRGDLKAPEIAQNKICTYIAAP